MAAQRVESALCGKGGLQPCWACWCNWNPTLFNVAFLQTSHSAFLTGWAPGESLGFGAGRIWEDIQGPIIYSSPKPPPWVSLAPSVLVHRFLPLTSGRDVEGSIVSPLGLLGKRKGKCAWALSRHLPSHKGSLGTSNSAKIRESCSWCILLCTRKLPSRLKRCPCARVR